MKISGFTFIKNGLSLGYPIKESIESIAPLCDEVVINVGFDNPELNGDDGTEAYLKSHFTDPKFIFLQSYWDPEVSSRGLILSQQTNIALEKCTGDLCLYIQGDEALHEDDYPEIKQKMELMKKHSHIQGLVFNYVHFYGNTNIIKHTRDIYRREVRLIRNNIGIKSHLDAQSFRHEDGSKPHCLLTKARVFHYGWARSEQVMAKKVRAMEKLYHGQDYEVNQYSYQKIWGLRPFTQTHPNVMEEWIKQNKNDLDFSKLKYKVRIKDLGLAITDGIESLTNFRIGEYKSYKLTSVK